MSGVNQAFDWLVKHRLTTVAMAVAMPIVLLSWNIYHRDPPIEWLPHDTSTTVYPKARAGQEVTFNFPIKRDFSRNCSFRLQRYFFDSTGAQRKMGSEETVSYEGRMKRDALNPGRLKVTIVVPPNAPSGHSHVMNEGFYVCPANLTTLIVPIPDSYQWDMEVLPPLVASAPA